MLADLRFRLGRWLLRPYAGRVWKHYYDVSDPESNPHGAAAAERCEYIALGVLYGSGAHNHRAGRRTNNPSSGAA